MKKENKEEIVNALSESVAQSGNFYITDTSGLTVNQTNALRRLCFERGIKMQVVKNTLIRKALEQANIETEGFAPVLKGSSSIMFAESFTAPAKLIKEFRTSNPKPVLKAAYIEQSLYVGDDKIETLLTLKSKEELIADVIALLQSPMKNVISGLQGSGGQKIAGILKTLSEKEA
jgi:large subunit ribosomal protein L10